jgi:hypothetical protein
MSKCSGNVRAICGLAAAAAIMVACQARAEDGYCPGATPPLNDDFPKNPMLLLGHVTSTIHPVKGDAIQGCPSRAPACAMPDYLAPGHRVIISKRHDGFICATYIDANGVDLSDWLPVDAVADDKAEPVALADWLGHWRHSSNAHDGSSYDEGDITVKAGKAGALQIEGARNKWSDGREDGYPSKIRSDVTPAGNRLSFTNDTNDGTGCKVRMQRLGPWLIVRDDERCGAGDYENTTFGGVYTRMPSAGVGEAAAAADGVTPIGYLESMGTGHGPCSSYYISLWRTAETVVGRFFCVDGRYNSGPIKQVSYDQKTGRLTFTAPLSFSFKTDPTHVFKFDGRLAATEVTGTLKHVDESHPERGATSERITFKKSEEVGKLKSYPSLADWSGDQSCTGFVPRCEKM